LGQVNSSRSGVQVYLHRASRAGRRARGRQFPMSTRDILASMGGNIRSTTLGLADRKQPGADMIGTFVLIGQHQQVARLDGSQEAFRSTADFKSACPTTSSGPAGAVVEAIRIIEDSPSPGSEDPELTAFRLPCTRGKRGHDPNRLRRWRTMFIEDLPAPARLASDRNRGPQPRECDSAGL